MQRALPFVRRAFSLPIFRASGRVAELLITVIRPLGNESEQHVKVLNRIHQKGDDAAGRSDD